jgi:hypothetical protein
MVARRTVQCRTEATGRNTSINAPSKADATHKGGNNSPSHITSREASILV